MQHKIDFQYTDADEAMKLRIAEEWGEKAARHMHLEDGFSIVALDGENLVGLISTSGRSCLLRWMSVMLILTSWKYIRISDDKGLLVD